MYTEMVRNLIGTKRNDRQLSGAKTEFGLNRKPPKISKQAKAERINEMYDYLELNEKESDKMSMGELMFMIGSLTLQRNMWRGEIKKIERKQVWHNTKEIKKDFTSSRTN